jgi:hypothetical protein
MVLTCADCGAGKLYFFDADRVGGARKSMRVENAFAVGIDNENDLYVSGGGNRGFPVTITEIVPGGGGGGRYSDDVVNPVNVVALNGNSPAFYVANGAGPQELRFPGGGSNRAHGYDDPNLTYMTVIAADAAGDVYVGGTNAKGKPEIDLIAPKADPIDLHLDIDAKLYALNLDARGDLVAAESNVGVAVFHPSKPRPFLWFDRTKKSVETHPVSITFGDEGNRIYILDDQYVFVYDYVSGTRLWTYRVPHSLVCCTAQVTIQPRVPLFDPNVYRETHPGFVYWTDAARQDR